MTKESAQKSERTDVNKLIKMINVPFFDFGFNLNFSKIFLTKAVSFYI